MGLRPDFRPEKPDSGELERLLPTGLAVNNHPDSKDEDALMLTQRNRAIKAGGANAKRSAAEFEMDLVDEARLYLSGYSGVEIAAWIEKNRSYRITYQSVYDDIALIMTRWQTQYLMEINAWKAQELARILQLERTYWEEFENSKKEKTVVEQNKTADEWGTGTGKKGKAGYSRTATKVKREKRDGNLECLRGVERCIEARCKILGLNAPNTININWREQAKAAGINPDGYVNELADQLFKAATMARSGEQGSLGNSTETATSE